MANSELKLYYFDGRGRAEIARLILTAADKEYKDIRFSFDEWPEYKAKTPFGQCPMLEIDGQRFAQSLAIISFLAREFGFHGQTNIETLSVEQVVLLVEDISRICGDVIHMEDEEERKVQTQKMKEEITPTFLGYFEKLLKDNGTGYFVGDRLTLADIAVFDLATGTLGPCVDIDDNYPLLKQNIATVNAHRKIGPYVAARPITLF